MSLIEKFRRQNTAESKPTNSERVILVPEDAGAAWTATVLAKYCDGSYRTKVKTWEYYRPRNCTRRKMTEYKKGRCRDNSGQPAKIDGRLVGVKLIPSEQDDEILIPHVVLDDAEQDSSTDWVAKTPEQRIVVPLTDNGEDLILYPDPY